MKPASSPLYTVKGWPIYSGDMKIPGEHFIIREFKASDTWENMHAGVVQKVDDENSSVNTMDSLSGAVYDTNWRQLNGMLDDVALGKTPFGVMSFSPTVLKNKRFQLGPRVRAGLTDDFNHCWVPATRCPGMPPWTHWNGHRILADEGPYPLQQRKLL